MLLAIIISIPLVCPIKYVIVLDTSLEAQVVCLIELSMTMSRSCHLDHLML